VIDLDAARWMAFQDHVPETVIYVIAVVALLAAMVVGYTFGLGRLRQLVWICTLSLAITLVLAVIIDLDRPREGLIRVSQQPLIDLQKQLQ
jgi:prepilin signal peptidase PulO-like enzyme (type II secretory pathway)